MPSAIDHILAQHRDMARVLKTLEAIADGPLDERREADIARLHDICHYLRVFPDKVHHPAEERYVFGPLRAAAHEHAAVLARVQDEHERCESLTTALHESVTAFERGEADVQTLRAAVREYLDFQFDHMRREENEVLPVAEELLDARARGAAAAAFAAHADPMFGENLAAGFDALRQRIVSAR